jgi:STE24 endopeptidase
LSSPNLLREGFSLEQVERARRYHRPLYVALAVDLSFAAGVLSVLSFTRVGDRLYGAVDGLPWWGAAPAFAALVVLVSALVRLPLGFWRGFVRERRWGLSTQRVGGWVADVVKGMLVGAVFSGLVELGLVALVRLPLGFWRGFVRERRWGLSTQRVGGWVADVVKGMLVGAVFSGLVELGLVALVRSSPGWWPLWAALALAAGVLVLSFLAPVVLEPLFNRFRPLDDAELVRDLRALADRAGVPVREVLVADASRRTNKVNAYVSGIGRTRRVVLYDTLLEKAGAPELRLVVAHELGHRRDRHILKATLLGMAGAVAAVLLVWAALGRDAGDPRNAPVVLLLGLGLELVTLAPGSALSRRWERAADRASLELTDDLPAFETAHRELALANLSDLDPPRLVYLLLFSHPTPPERIAASRAITASR